MHQHRLSKVAFFGLFSIFSGYAYGACLPSELCAQFSGIEDFNAGTYAYNGDVLLENDVCPHTQNDDENAYQLTFTGSGVGGAYRATTGAVDITFTLKYRDSTDAFVPVNPLTPVTYSGANVTTANCSVGGETGTVQIFIPEENLQMVTSGTYVGSVQVEMQAD